MWRLDKAGAADDRAWHLAAAGGVSFIALVCFAASTTTQEASDAPELASLAAYLGLTWVLWTLVHRAASRRVLLVWPVMVTLGVTGESYVAPHAATLCTGVIVLGFLFVGLTQRPWTSLIVWPFAVVALWSTFDLPLSQALVRVSLASLVWISVAELPAWLTTSLRAARSEVARLAATDALTGLPNRRAWDEWLVDTDDGGALSLLVVDLDHFKRYNDAHGHLGGDLLLVEFATALRTLVDGHGLVARWGGEEFVVILPGSDDGSAHALAQQVMAAVPGAETCSIGAATRRTGEDVTSVLARADAALYRAKADGRSRVVAA
ncbi:diguanylate cyclase (GGDEF) domain-containing protein [Nocardioides terrae]|uniref:Diguanylate cyclase (GGDEF) domain-containing protein n=1 Tax=Nocardioides terrae TaxID=574651 RepID=A0A1I1JLF2_9ACTN|nr:GGDEF domain-containing protein [Nocardioides terrae]SFC49374.1 diguanylate cyclase (GGDEF) domain-containing protein [Nocardioides terrae]